MPDHLPLPHLPNPLVTELARKLGLEEGDLVAKATEYQETAAIDAETGPEATPEQRKAAKKRLDNAALMELALADALAADPTMPPLVTFAGFLGGTIVTGDTRWRVFYLDPKLLTWLLVAEGAILRREVLEDVTAPFGKRDLIWLRSSASVTDGSGPPRADQIEAQFVRGDFIGAGDFSASLTGGTFSRATGLLCEVQTPGCCGKYTR